MGGTVGLLIGAELVVRGASGIIQQFGVSEAFFGMTIVAIGTTIILLTLNLGLIALVRPVTVDPWVLKFHVPFLIGCVLFVGALLMMAKRLERWTETVLILLYLLYLAVNLRAL